MNKFLMSLLFGAFILTGTSFAQTQTPPAAEPVPVAAVPQVVKPMHHGRAERHPELRRALRKLRGAKQDLEKAASDFGGHKVRAIEAINHAIEELNDALQLDRK